MRVGKTGVQQACDSVGSDGFGCSISSSVRRPGMIVWWNGGVIKRFIMA